ncbi:hypothetical protein [Cupriavidus sp. UME77]|uniref:hypothetical protein n=1 Tax=Cupriavidus sp. UME77 TaxID=1862321 RepID=UPI0015FFDE68|nr:hypothetical protein [Cupriavidus sp. UME77]MBB1632453.1 hypothetical protein [Cupriavidus sp. UME77]
MARQRAGSPPFPVIQRRDENGKLKPYRMIHFDEDCKVLVLFDLAQKEGDGKKELTIVDSDGTDFKVVDDHVETSRMRARRLYEREIEERHDAKTRGEARRDKRVDPPILTPRDERTWKENKQYMRKIFGNPQRIAGLPAYDFYTDHRWRGKVLRDQAKTAGVIVKTLTRAFWQGIRYGGDMAAVMPLTDRSGAAGSERPAEPGAGRSGVKEAASKLDGMPQEMRDGMTPEWRRRVQELMKENLREFWDDDFCGIDTFAGRAHFKAKAKFFDQLKARYFLPSDSKDDKKNRPSREMVNYYVDWCLERYFDDLVREVDQCLRQEMGLPPEPPRPRSLGTTRARGAGILKKIQMDGTIPSHYMLVVEDDEGNSRDVRKPTVVLASSGRPMVVVGWHVTAWPENGEAYRRCLWNVFSDKRERLLALGMDPDRGTGIFQGYGDEVETDRKPGMRFSLWALDEARLNAELTLPWTPQQKGQVESTNGHIKRLLDELVRWGLYLSEKFKGTYANEEAINKALPKGADAVAKMIRGRTLRRMAQRKAAMIRLTYRAFERLLVECINRWNTRTSRSRSTAAVVNRRRTPASIYRHAATKRVGAQAKNDRTARQMGLAVLQKFTQTVRNGHVLHKKCHYGIGASRSGEFDAGAHELIQYLDEGKDEITFVVPPDGLTIEWLKDRERETWITLRAVVESGSDFGTDADLFGLEANGMLENADAAEADRQDADPLNENDFVEEIHEQNEKAIKDKSHNTTGSQKRRSVRAQQDKQTTQDFAEITRANTVAPSPPLDALPAKSMLGDSFDMNEYQTLLTSLYPKGKSKPA